MLTKQPQVQDREELPRHHRQHTCEVVRLALSISPTITELPPSLRTTQLTLRSGVLAGGFGGVAGFFALFFFAEVPKVRDDIMKKIPIVDRFFTNEIPPEDNPF